MGDYGFGGEVRFSSAQPSLSALRAGVLSSCFAKKKVAKEEGDPKVGAGVAGPLRYSPSRAACQNSPTAQTRQAEIPRPACVAQRRPRGPENHPDSSVLRSQTGSEGQPEKTSKNENRCLRPTGFPGPLRGAEQRRFGWDQGEDCLRGIAPSSAAPHSNRVAQGIPAGDTDPGVAFSLATFFWRSKRKYARAASAENCAASSTWPEKK